MLIGGPSATTALVIEQARSMGFKGGFIMIDQAKQDYIAVVLKSTKVMDNLIGTGGVVSVIMPGGIFEKRYKEKYKRMVTWECALNYTGVYALAKAIVTAGTVTDVYKIRAAFAKALETPMLGDKYPNEVFGIEPAGRLQIMASVGTITNGKFDKSELYVWWGGQKEYERVKKLSTATNNPIIFLKR